MRILFAFILILTFQTFACAQKFIEHFDRSLTGSLGASYLLSLDSHGPYTTSYYFNNYGPSVSVGWRLHFSDKNRFETQLRFSIFSSTWKDTLILSPANSDPNSYNKYFDLKGRLNLISLGCSWQHYFGENSKCGPYMTVGVEFLQKYRGDLTGFYVSNSFSGIKPFTFGSLTLNSLNLRMGFGLTQQLSDRLRIFEHLDMSYMILDDSMYGAGTGAHFSPLNYFQELLLNLSVGLAFQHKTAVDPDH